MAHNEPLMDVLNLKTLRTVQKSGLDYIHINENEQEGTGFGARFSNAIQHVFKKGYDQVICIGNDSPQLEVSHLHRTAISLDGGIAMNGPSLDGGFYLMGIHKIHFDSDRFEKLPWQTSELASSYLSILQDRGIANSSLEHLADLDSQKDIDLFLKGKDQRTQLAQLIISTLSHIVNSYTYQVKETQSVSFQLPLNKGSPLSIAA